MTASLRRDMSSSTQVAKLARAAKGRGGISNSVGDVHVNVAATNASPKDIGRATQDSLSRRLARSWSVTAPEPSSA